MLFVVHFDSAPRVTASANLAAVGRDNLTVSTNDCKRNLRDNLGILGNGFLVVELIARAFEDLDRMMLNIS
jgi:hypothetical protein